MNTDRTPRKVGPLDVGRAIHDGEPVDGWHGAIDDVRVFPVALDRSQVGEVAGHRAWQVAVSPRS